MERVLIELCGKLQGAFGERLSSVVLYGSGAAEDRHASYSDLNVLCVLDRVTVEEMRAAEGIFRWWRGLGNPAPLLITEDELARSSDCFAIETHDIRESHRILAGRDVISNIPVDDSFYRAQVEHELRAKLLRLRQKAAGMLHDSDPLRQLLLDSVSTFCVLFRHALELHGIKAGMKKRDIVARVRETFVIDTGSIERLLDVREGRVKRRDLHPLAVLPGYLAAIDAAAEAVDRLPK